MRVILALLFFATMDSAEADLIEGVVVHVEELKPQADPANPNLLLRTRKITIKSYDDEPTKTVTLYSPMGKPLSDYSSSTVPNVEVKENTPPVQIRKLDEVVMLVDKGGDGILRGHANTNFKLMNRQINRSLASTP